MNDRQDEKLKAWLAKEADENLPAIVRERIDATLAGLPEKPQGGFKVWLSRLAGVPVAIALIAAVLLLANHLMTPVNKEITGNGLSNEAPVEETPPAEESPPGDETEDEAPLSEGVQPVTAFELTRFYHLQKVAHDENVKKDLVADDQGIEIRLEQVAYDKYRLALAFTYPEGVELSNPFSSAFSPGNVGNNRVEMKVNGEPWNGVLEGASTSTFRVAKGWTGALMEAKLYPHTFDDEFDLEIHFNSVYRDYEDRPAEFIPGNWTFKTRVKRMDDLLVKRFPSKLTVKEKERKFEVTGIDITPMTLRLEVKTNFQINSLRAYDDRGIELPGLKNTGVYNTNLPIQYIYPEFAPYNRIPEYLVVRAYDKPSVFDQVEDRKISSILTDDLLKLEAELPVSYPQGEDSLLIIHGIESTDEYFALEYEIIKSHPTLHLGSRVLFYETPDGERGLQSRIGNSLRVDEGSYRYKSYFDPINPANKYFLSMILEEREEYDLIHEEIIYLD